MTNPDIDRVEGWVGAGMSALDEILKMNDRLAKIYSLTPDEQYMLELHHRGEPTHFADSDGKLHPRTRPPDKVIVPPPTFEETGA